MICAAVLTLAACSGSGQVDQPVQPAEVTHVFSGQTCSAQQIDHIADLSHSLGATAEDLKGRCVAEFRIGRNLLQSWYPMHPHQQTFCGSIVEYRASNSTIGGAYDRDNDVNVYVTPAPGDSKQLFDAAIATWLVRDDWAEMEVTVPEPLRGDQRFFPQPWKQGKRPHMDSGPHCFYGAWIKDGTHPGKAHAEIHPISTAWWRESDLFTVFSVQDETGRFDRCVKYRRNSNPQCTTSERAACVNILGEEDPDWGREWTRGPMEIAMQYHVEIPRNQRPKHLYLDVLADREVVTDTDAAQGGGSVHRVVDSSGDLILELSRSAATSRLVSLGLLDQYSCASSDGARDHVMLNLNWALGKEAKWIYGDNRARDYWGQTPNVVSGRAFVVFTIRDGSAPVDVPLAAHGLPMENDAATSAEMSRQDSLLTYLVSLRVRWIGEGDEAQPLADLIFASNMPGRIDPSDLRPTYVGNLDVRPREPVEIDVDDRRALVVRNIPLLSGGEIQISGVTDFSAAFVGRDYRLSLPDYRAVAAVLARKPTLFARPDRPEAWTQFVQSTGPDPIQQVAAPSSFVRVSEWDLTFQTRLVPVLEDDEIEVSMWEDSSYSVETLLDFDQLMLPEQPFPDITSHYEWSVTASDYGNDRGLEIVDEWKTGPVSYAIPDAPPSLSRLKVAVDEEAPPLVEVVGRFQAASTRGDLSSGSVAIYSLALVGDPVALAADVLRAAAEIEGVASTQAVRQALDPDGQTEISPYSFALLTRVATLAEDGLVELPEFADLRSALRNLK